MIYDNKYANIHAERLMHLINDPEQMQREIAGELMRFYRLGQMSVYDPVQQALKNIKQP